MKKNKWQPIETAPVDEWIMVVAVDEEKTWLPAVVIKKLDGLFYESYDEDGEGVDNNKWELTHWRPLPKLPKYKEPHS